MRIDETYYMRNATTGDDRDLESGDNPDERAKRHEEIPEEEDDADYDLESGDNPDERRRGL